jgi:hypothetical protein
MVFLSEDRADVADQEPAARVAGFQFGQVLVETRAGLIDVNGAEQADLVIDPQRLRRQLGPASEFADGQQLAGWPGRWSRP